MNAGGDLRHRGDGPVPVGIEDPLHPYDNVAPMLVVPLDNAALATSGGARRGWDIAGEWYPHVIDPRSGIPVRHHASVSVLAPDAATADVVATVVGVLTTDEAVAFVTGIPSVSCCAVSPTGELRTSSDWPAGAG